MKKLFLIATCILLFVGCQKEPQAVEKSGNFNIEFLFEVNGCKVYRFFDGRTVYFTSCNGRTSYEYRSGSDKNQTTHEMQAVTGAKDSEQLKEAKELLHEVYGDK